MCRGTPQQAEEGFGIRLDKAVGPNRVGQHPACCGWLCCSPGVVPHQRCSPRTGARQLYHLRRERGAILETLHAWSNCQLFVLTCRGPLKQFTRQIAMF